MKVYSVGDTSTRLAGVALGAEKSARAKPVTASLNTTLTGIGAVWVGSDAVVLKATVGPTLSKVRLKVFEIVLPFPVESKTWPAAMETLTKP